jgi:hypothetical protein
MNQAPTQDKSNPYRRIKCGPDESSPYTRIVSAEKTGLPPVLRKKRARPPFFVAKK